MRKCLHIRARPSFALQATFHFEETEKGKRLAYSATREMAEHEALGGAELQRIWLKMVIIY